MTHLWDVKHPYYWSDGCYHQNGHHFTFASWAAFMAERGGADDDLNLVGRWDWIQDVDDDENVITAGAGSLFLGYVLQRKGFTQSCSIHVTAADEPMVREWLASKWAHMKALWAPFGEDAS